MSIVKYSESKYLSNLEDYEIKELSKLIKKSLNDYRLDIINLHFSYTSSTTTMRSHNLYFEKLFKSFLKHIRNDKWILNYNEVILNHLNNDAYKIMGLLSKVIKDRLMIKFNSYIIVFLNDIKRILFEHYLIKQDVTTKIGIDKLETYHIYTKSLKDYNISFNEISKKTNKILKKLGYGYSLLYNSSFKYQLLINKIDEVEVINLKHFYYDRNYFLSTSYLEEYLLRNYNNLNEIHFILPLYLHSTSKIFSSKNNGYFKIYFEYARYFDSIFKLINNVSNSKQLYISIPNMINYEHYINWSIIIKNYYSLLNRSVNVGIVCDDLEITDEIYESSDLDHLMINFKYIIKNTIDEGLITINDFFKILSKDLQDIRNLAKSTKKEIIFTKIDVFDEEIRNHLEKLPVKIINI